MKHKIVADTSCKKEQRFKDTWLQVNIWWISKNGIFKNKQNLGLLQKLQNLLPRSALIKVYWAFVISYLDYGDIFHDQAYNMSFHHKLESTQYNAYLVITGAIRGASKEKLYKELGLESLQLQRWYRKLGMFHKIYKNKVAQYLLKLITEKTYAYATKNMDKQVMYLCKTISLMLRILFKIYFLLNAEVLQGNTAILKNNPFTHKTDYKCKKLLLEKITRIMLMWCLKQFIDYILKF